MLKRNLLTLLLATSLTPIVQADDDVTDLSLAQMRRALDSGALTSEQIVQTYLTNIHANEDNGERINAITTLNEGALEAARAWDRHYRQHPDAAYPALAGIPFLAKDNFDTTALPTTGGSLALEDSIPPDNAHVVQAILDSGAILLGKTNMSEFAASYGWLGYSSFGGQTRNPFNPLRDASGSSSGSAAAVAAHFAPFALGSDTSGSVRAPASVTGMVGLRPTLGLYSRDGIIPLSLTTDTAGIITRSVADQALIADLIAGEDVDDAATLWQNRQRPEFTIPLQTQALNDSTLLVVDNFAGGNAEVDAIVEHAVVALENTGAKVQHITLPRAFETLWSDVMGPVGEAEFKPQIERYLSTLPDTQPQTLSELIERLKQRSAQSDTPANPARIEGLEQADHTQLTDSSRYIDILTQRIPVLREQLTQLLDENGADAFVFATMSCPASVVHGENDASYECHADDPYAAAYIAAATGFPEVTVNAGTISGRMPVGVSFLGRAGDDARLIDLAYVFEQTREAPTLSNSLISKNRHGDSAAAQ